MKRSLSRGFSLIELMVSITIGLIILTAIGVAYTSTTNMTRQRDALSELQGPAIFALRMISRDIAESGFVDMLDALPGAPFAKVLLPLDDDRSNHYVRSTLGGVTVTAPIQAVFPEAVPVFACDGAMNSSPLVLASTTPVAPACTAPDTTTLTHAIQIVKQGLPNAANPLLALRPSAANTGQGVDCLQQTPAGAGYSPAGQQFIINRYFVQVSGSDGISELFCQGSGNATPQPLARGVQEFTVRFQLASIASTTTTVAGSGPSAITSTSTIKIASGASSGQFFNATDVATSTLSWAGVTGVDVCMVVASATNSTGISADAITSQPSRPTCARNANGSFAADVVRAAGDNRVWRRYTNYVAMRNAIFSTPN